MCVLEIIEDKAGQVATIRKPRWFYGSRDNT